MEDEIDSQLNEISQLFSSLLEAQEQFIDNFISIITSYSSTLQDEMAHLEDWRLNVERELTDLALLEDDNESTLVQLSERVCETDNSETCVICLEEPKRGQLVKELSCSHVFHSTCVDTWRCETQKKKNRHIWILYDFIITFINWITQNQITPSGKPIIKNNINIFSAKHTS
uniref:RING-type domain-containing protein n=1 Tax=Strigamia maritima TaxID=126957 RepID=T1JKH6_STRMM